MKDLEDLTYVGDGIMTGVDKNRATWISVGCWRETGRLSRMIELYQFVLMKAKKKDIDEQILLYLRGLYDHKGNLYVFWRGKPSKALMGLVDEVWSSMGEDISHHACSVTGKIYASDDGDYQQSYIMDLILAMNESCILTSSCGGAFNKK